MKNSEINGFVYLIQPATLINTNCYKIGCSKNLTLTRLQQYLNGSKYICIFRVKFPFKVEKYIKASFNLKYIPYAGTEYY